MDRRHFVAGATTALVSLSASKVAAYERLVQGPYGETLVQVGVSSGSWSHIYSSQRASQWCWAASLQMLFASSDYYVDQTTIVRTAYGRVVNLPAFSARVIAALSNRDWVDEDGNEFSSRLVAAYDFYAGVAAINDAMILESLSQEQPMVVCNRSHAMLAIGATFRDTQFGPQILDVAVFDPWPGRGLRGADRPGEFLAAHQGGELTYIGLAEIY